VGDLLRARVGTNANGRVYRALGKSSFRDAPVKYDMFTRVLDGLKPLGLVGHRKGQTRYHETGFEPGHKVTISGRAARLWATPKLLKLAEEHGIHSGNIGDHFAPEPPTNPLVLKDFATGRGRYRESGPVIKDYERTPETQRLERDVKELNEFLARFELTGGRHEGYIRIFNNRSWKKGGRLYGPCEGSYQQLPETKCLEMQINGEPVAGIDIKASFLTIYHAKHGVPLEGREDTYARGRLPRRCSRRFLLFGSWKDTHTSGLFFTSLRPKQSLAPCWSSCGATGCQARNWVDERPTLGAPATGDVETRPESFAVVMAIKTWYRLMADQ
jgi:hypothetical protein